MDFRYGTPNFDKAMAAFEDFQKKHSSRRGRLDLEQQKGEPLKVRGQFYCDGEVNQLFLAFLFGVSYGASMAECGGFE